MESKRTLNGAINWWSIEMSHRVEEAIAVSGYDYAIAYRIEMQPTTPDAFPFQRRTPKL